MGLSDRDRALHSRRQVRRNTENHACASESSCVSADVSPREFDQCGLGSLTLASEREGCVMSKPEVNLSA